MKILGIESSCDETAAAVVEDGVRLLSNVVNSQIDIHAAYGGVIPEVAARSHIEVILPVVEKALSDANCIWDDIDAIGVTYAPGLVGSLLIGSLTARTLAYLKKKPLYAVHHVEGHVYANFLTKIGIESQETRDKGQETPQTPQIAPAETTHVASEEYLSSPDASKSHPDSSRTKRSDPADDSDEMQRASWREDNRCEDVVATMSESIFANNPVIIQGITGHHGAFHTRGMLDAGTNIVAGVTPGKGGETIHDIPVYNSVAEAQKIHQATTSVIFVPARFARAAMIEALDAGITLVVCITEGIPVHDMLTVYHHAVDKKATIIGPNCPGLIIPGSHKLGIIAAHITTPGQTAIISRSGTLTYELADALTKKGIGQRIVLGIGGDPIQGMNFSEALQMCEHDPHVDRIVMVGEIGGTSEQIAAEFIKHNVTKPVYGLVVGHSLPAGQQFGHAGAIVGGLGESAKEKTDYMAEQGITMSNTLDELIGQLR